MDNEYRKRMGERAWHVLSLAGFVWKDTSRAGVFIHLESGVVIEYAEARDKKDNCGLDALAALIAARIDRARLDARRQPD